jgi:hypothetical protein
MINPTPIEQMLLVIGGIIVIAVGLSVLAKSGKRSQDHAENARVGTSVLVGVVIIAVGLGMAALVSGPGQSVVNWISGIFS